MVTGCAVGSLMSLTVILTITTVMNPLIGAAQDPPPAANQRPEPDVVAIKEDADLDLKCPIETNEDMIISWTCENEPANIRSSRIHVTDLGTLRIHSAKLGDSCNYRCEAADGFGTLSVTIRVIIVEKGLVEQLSRKNGTLARGKPAAIVDEASGSRPATSLSAAKQHEEGQQLRASQANDLDIQVRPAAVRIDRNKSFTLECRVWHAPDSPPPQMIWLKEFMGPTPDTLREAHQQNLVSIDNVYYHSLNWPRSISHSKKAACANSALLIRQSSYVHSGRYICFAGYPPSIINSNLALSSSSSSASAPSAAAADQLVPIISINGKQTRSLPKYKMAFASVSVEDTETSATNHRSSAEAPSRSVGERSKRLLMDVLSTSSWPRDLTIASILFSFLICAVRLVSNHRTRLGEFAASIGRRAGARGSQPSQCDQLDEDHSPGSLAIKQLNNLPVNNHQHQASSLLRADDHCLPPFGIESHLDHQEQEDTREGYSEEANRLAGRQPYTENPYAEIGDRDWPMGVNLSPISSPDEPIYKVPRSSNNNNNNNNSNKETEDEL